MSDTEPIRPAPARVLPVASQRVAFLCAAAASIIVLPLLITDT